MLLGLAPFTQMGNHSSYFGAIVCVMLECGSGMDAKKKLLLQQHIDGCFKYLSTKEEQRKRYDTKFLTIHPMFIFTRHVLTSYDGDYATLVSKFLPTLRGVVSTRGVEFPLKAV